MISEQETLFTNLQKYLSEQIGSSVKIISAKPLAGGASRDTWFFSIESAGQEQHLVVRRDLPSQMAETALTRKQEFDLMDAAYQQGVKVARVRWSCEDKSVLGSPFFVMDYVAGTSIGRRVIKREEFASARQTLPQQMAEQLAMIHRLNFETPELAFLKRPQKGQSAASEAVQDAYLYLDNLAIQNPVWEWTLRWAETHMPEANELSFIHGDYRIGNILVDEEKGLSAVIDWEFGHIGDPDEDLGYLCMRDWRFGANTKRAAGLTERETFLRAYESASGRKVNRSSVDWWELMGNIRWGIICMAQANRHLSGTETSVELASLGRRSAEMQYESLRLIESYGIVK